MQSQANHETRRRPFPPAGSLRSKRRPPLAGAGEFRCAPAGDWAPVHALGAFLLSPAKAAASLKLSALLEKNSTRHEGSARSGAGAPRPRACSSWLAAQRARFSRNAQDPQLQPPQAWTAFSRPPIPSRSVAYCIEGGSTCVVCNPTLMAATVSQFDQTHEQLVRATRIVPLCTSTRAVRQRQNNQFHSVALFLF